MPEEHEETVRSRMDLPEVVVHINRDAFGIAVRLSTGINGFDSHTVYHFRVWSIKMLTLKEMVNSGKKVRFLFYREMELWYTTEDGFEFPVPIDDIGSAIFFAEDKAILFMRYIRKHIAYIEKAKLES
jgi:hypothetical protein